MTMIQTTSAVIEITLPYINFIYKHCFALQFQNDSLGNINKYAAKAIFQSYSVSNKWLRVVLEVQKISISALNSKNSR